MGSERSSEHAGAVSNQVAQITNMSLIEIAVSDVKRVEVQSSISTHFVRIRRDQQLVDSKLVNVPAVNRVGRESRDIPSDGHGRIVDLRERDGASDSVAVEISSVGEQIALRLRTDGERAAGIGRRDLTERASKVLEVERRREQAMLDLVDVERHDCEASVRRVAEEERRLVEALWYCR